MRLPSETPIGPVLVTGSSGRIGRAVIRAFSDAGVPTRLLDRVPFPGRPDALVADLCNVAALEGAMAGAAALVHLAATPDDAPFEESLVPNNVVGLERVLSAAARAGVRRWVLASSIQVNIRQSREGPWPVRVTDPITPLRWYAATKVFLESAGYSHARDHGVEVISIRLGWCPRDMEQVRQIEAEPVAQDTYLSPGDAGSLVLAAVTRPVPQGHHVVFGTSRPLRQWVFDPGPVRELLGWEPLDAWPVGAVGFGT
jgi:uronate dehydrogenase